MNDANYTPPPLPTADAAASAACLSLQVPDALGGMRLDQALAQLMPQHSRNRIKGWIDDGLVKVDGRARPPRHRLAGGESLAVAPSAFAVADAGAGAPRAQSMALSIVHEDAALFVIDKPAGLVVHPGAGNREGTLLNALLAQDPGLAAVPRAGIVHRLDKDTSGLLVVARTPEAHTALVRALARRDVGREYLAVAAGDIDAAVTIDAPIGRHPTARTTMAVVANGRAARTHVAPRRRFGVATLVEVKLDTGRTHQIRVHLAAIGHPLLGDPVYGRGRRSAALPSFPRQALHAWRLSFDHPSTGRALRFRAEPPADFAGLVDALAARSDA